MNDRNDAAGFWVCVTVATLLIAAMAAPLALGTVYVHNDLGYQFVPWRAFLADCLASGDRTAWCPNLFNGYYFLGEGGGVAHPGLRALYASLPLGPALNVEVVLPYAAMLAGFPLLLVRWGVRRDAAVVGGVVYAFGGPNFVHFIHPTLMAAYAHLPWLLLAVDVALRSPSPRRAVWAQAAVALLTASQVLSAHVQAVWISGMGEIAYVLFLAWRRPETRRRLGGLVTFKGLGCLGGAAQLLPQWEAFRDSARVRPTATYVAMGSIPPLNLLQWVAPYLTSSGVVMPPMATDTGVLAPVPTRHNDWRVHEFVVYMGAAVPALLVWLLARGRHLLPRSGRALAVLAVLIAVASLVLAFGDFTPLFRLTMRAPVVGRFRVPGRHLALFQLGVAALSALAYASLAEASSQRAGERLPWRRLWPLALPPALAVLACLAPRLPAGLWPWYARGGFVATTPLVLAGPVLVTASAALVALAARGSRAALLALPVLLAADLAAYDARSSLITPPQTLADYRQARPIPPGSAGGRVAFDKLHVVNQDAYMLMGLRPVDGYVSLPPRRTLTYKTPASLQAAGVEWVLTKDEKAPWRRVEGAMPRVRLVTKTVLSRASEEDLGRVDVATTAATLRPVPPLPDVPPGTARLATDRPGKLDVVTEAPTPQFLVVSESFHHGWRVKVDGHERRVYRVYGDFMGCLVPPGRHLVELRFRPTSQLVGFWTSVAALALTAVIPLAVSARSSRSVPAPHVAHTVARHATLEGRIGPG